MGEEAAREVQLSHTAADEEAGEAKIQQRRANGISGQSQVRAGRGYIWWLKIFVFAVLVLAGQTAATLLGRLYFEKGGKSKWLETLAQIVGFPILIPDFFFVNGKSRIPDSDAAQDKKRMSAFTRALFVLVSGIIFAACSMLFTVGLVYIPVSTFSLISASQLGFNALFSYFLNSLKFTPLTINSVVLLTISSVILVVQPDCSSSSDETHRVSSEKHVIGFMCTVVASAGCALLLNIAQLYFRKVPDREPIAAIFEFIIYESMIATGLFMSGEWRRLGQEMEGFGLGKVSYVMTLVWTAITWQVCTIGAGGLIYEVSSVFSNVVAVFGLPIVPVLAVFFFHDRMDGSKATSMVLAIWGFLSYAYQQCLDESSSKGDLGVSSVSVQDHQNGRD